MKMVVKKVIFFIILILVCYYGYILYSTHDVMKELCETTQMNEEQFAEDCPLIFFSRYQYPEEYKSHIIRYFTWCWGRKGKIYVTFKINTKKPNGEIYTFRDWTKVLIEKENGKWRVLGIEGEP